MHQFRRSLRMLRVENHIHEVVTENRGHTNARAKLATNIIGVDTKESVHTHATAVRLHRAGVRAHESTRAVHLDLDGRAAVLGRLVLDAAPNTRDHRPTRAPLRAITTGKTTFLKLSRLS